MREIWEVRLNFCLRHSNRRVQRILRVFVCGQNQGKNIEKIKWLKIIEKSDWLKLFENKIKFVSFFLEQSNGSGRSIKKIKFLTRFAQKMAQEFAQKNGRDDFELCFDLYQNSKMEVLNKPTNLMFQFVDFKFRLFLLTKNCMVLRAFEI